VLKVRLGILAALHQIRSALRFLRPAGVLDPAFRLHDGDRGRGSLLARLAGPDRAK
jgi:hypothetical protein